MHHLVPTIRLKTEKLMAFSFLSIPSSHLSPEFGAYHSLVCLLYFYYIHIYKQGITLFYTFSFWPSRYLFPFFRLFSNEVLPMLKPHRNVTYCVYHSAPLWGFCSALLYF